VREILDDILISEPREVVFGADGKKGALEVLLEDWPN
jgi:hypothetical protein